MTDLGSRPLIEFQAGVLNHSDCQQKYDKYDIVIDDKHILCAEIIGKTYYVVLIKMLIIYNVHFQHVYNFDCYFRECLEVP